ncbi:integrase domain-containing protein [Ramlibacter aquaticus]|uniref:Integrase domain-containing protein n=1 Tax=Ramlibacter aquaticus TaxID=2780094 RepID=A0ABR9SCQ3_9BURK|nr:integrase domain-containing protein [Ramlibacter aquaticus]MBE7940113.1 integrase domain-containing protein [Ramlibacter aquaticus]
MNGKDRAPLDGGSASEDEKDESSLGPGEREMTWRESNKKMRGERLAELEAEKRVARREAVGDAQSVMRQACQRQRDIIAQVNFVLGRVEWRAIKGKKRFLGEGSVTRYGEHIRKAYKDLRTLPEGRGVQRCTDLRRKHAVALVKHWLETGVAAATIQNRTSALRRWLDLMGKPDVIPCDQDWLTILRQHGVDTRKLVVEKVAVTPKDWESNGVDPMELIEKVWMDCEVVGAQLLAQLEFGARVRESYSTNPFMDHMGNTYHFERGTKGGRRRQVELDPDRVVRAGQEEALRRIKAVAAKHPKRFLARPGDTAKQTRSRYYYITRKHGITRKDLGVTSHGLRHQYLQRRYKGTSGLPAPVQNEVPASEYLTNAEAVDQAMQITALDAGHWRKRIQGAYTGSVGKLTKIQQKNMNANLALLQDREDVDKVLQDFGATGLWFIGRAASGLNIGDGQAFDMVVLRDSYPTNEERKALVQQLQALTGKPMRISVIVGIDEVSSDALEVVYLSQSTPLLRSGT